MVIKKFDFVEFDWTTGNSVKAFRHGVPLADMEYLFSRDVLILFDKAHSRQEARFMAIGKNERGRPLMVSFTVRTQDGNRLIRVISARYMHRNGKEEKRYEEIKKHLEAEKERPR